MFTKLSQTKFPPTDKPMMVFDGKCGFCRYWVVKWMKVTGLSVNYSPYQEVAKKFKDIPEQHFKEAVRYIDLDGNIKNGPDAAYITYYNNNKVTFLHKWYLNKGWFTKFSDWTYQWVADHRDFMSKVSIRLFGKNPANPKGFWKGYLAFFLIVLTALIRFFTV